jgi:hypothetical protein
MIAHRSLQRHTSTHSRPTSAPRQPGECGEIASDQRLFLFPSPAFDLPLGGHGILDALEILMEDRGYRPTAGGIAVKRACLVLGDPRFQPARRPDVVRAIGAAQNVEVSAHSAPPATARSISASKFAAMA